ncbi:MAG: carbon storage regulator [Pirellulales bacterium]|nr:carbon storage regulator [Pirellulales bacterium]
MLVLSRKIGESLVIDGNIRVTVVRVSGNRVALGVEAPDDVRVLRGELRPFGDEPVAAQEPEEEAPAKRLSRHPRRNELVPSTTPLLPQRLARRSGFTSRLAK